MRITAVSSALVLGLTLGSLEQHAQANKPKPFTVKAKLIDIPGKFPPDDLYDYAYVMKYRVIGGKLDKRTILVAHYKPRRKRSRIKGKMKKIVGGKLKRFRVGDIHRLKLVVHNKKLFSGAMVDDYFAKDRKSVRYWALRADKAK